MRARSNVIGMTHRTARLVGVTPVIAILMSVAGCVTTAGGTLGELARSSKGAASDTASAEFALNLYTAGRSTVGVSATALSGALTKVTDTQGSVASTSVSSRQERKLRAETLTDLHVAVTAIQDAQDVVAGTPGAPSANRARSDLISAVDALARLGHRP